VGSLSLDSIRIDFEGGLFLPDLGWLPTLIHLADEDPALRAALPELPRGPVEGDLTQEAQRFGAFLVELITFEAVPAGLSPAQALDQAQFWTPQGPQPLPVSVRQGLARLVGGAEPYETLEGALKAFEKIVYEDEDGPSTFSLAHLMHILFRQDYERQRDQLDLELATLRQEDKLWAAKPTRSSKGVLAAGLLAAAAAGIGTYMLMRNHESPGRTEASAPPPAQVQLPRQEPPQRPVQAVQSPGLPPQARPKHDPLPAREPVLPQKEGNVRTAPSSPKPTAAPSGAGVQDRPAQIRSLAHFPWPQGVPRETVSLRVFIHEDGHPLRATVVPGASPAPRITQAACEAAMKSTFLPAIRNGKAVRDWVQVQFN
jgi:protein TonB